MMERLTREQVVVYCRCGDERLADLAWTTIGVMDERDAALAENEKLREAAKATANDVELLMSSAWSRTEPMEQTMGQLILDRLRAALSDSGEAGNQEGERRMAFNPEPLSAESIPTCQTCKKRAPWCSCGSADYR